ncbi:MerR family transcriptional regulator [Enterococcus alishanensis]|uniref:MerR family transcriptional regulator n=1 Tax=Enterococcus alishanensis TaxID=1303817 RepID=A0ABS6TCA0_9ENTE|nr:MerR family transcriptional regulator [Enterococcus alishanensis]MBV7390510.1 MerR family transcriptional regulator [Enterococcus alishanensis]
MNIKEVADLFNLTTDTIRYYEKIGVIPPVTRDQRGYRDFQKKDLNWVFLVKSLRNAGVSIESLIEFARLSQIQGDERLAQKDILKNQLNELDEKIAELHQTRDLLAYKIETYDEHIALFNSGKMTEDQIEELWKMKHFNKNKETTGGIINANS